MVKGCDSHQLTWRWYSATFSAGKGHTLLTTRRGWDKGNRASVESLLNKRCTILSAPPADSPHPDFLSRAAAARLRYTSATPPAAGR